MGWTGESKRVVEHRADETFSEDPVGLPDAAPAPKPQAYAAHLDCIADHGVVLPGDARAS